VPTVLLTAAPGAERTRLLLTHASDDFDVRLLPPSAPEVEKRRALADADFLVLFGTGVSDDALRGAKRLKLIQLVSAGFDGINLGLCRELGIPVANNGGANALDVAEHTLAFMLAFYRRLPTLNERMRSDPSRLPDTGATTYTVHGKTVGIIGLGNIGRRVARLLNAFGATAVYADAVPAPPEVERELGVERVHLNELLRRSDIVTLHVPLTPGTRHLIGSRELALMKPNAVLVNTCRGGVVDESALIDALREKRIAGACLDGLEKEPPSPDNPLLTLENVLLTPHSAGITYDTWERRSAFVFANLRRVCDGETPLGLVSDALPKPLENLT
jgi:phosphoglycerate dehydrogenase-like enzyme